MLKTLQQRLSRKLTEYQIPPGRFFTIMAVAISMILFSVGVFLVDPDIADYDLPPFQPDSIFENVILFSARAIMLTLGWPLVGAALLGGDRLFFFAFFPLLILTGLFWALFVEWILAVRRR